MKKRLILYITAPICGCLLIGGLISPVWADWTTKPSLTGYNFNTGNFQTPPPGGWEDVMQREIQQEQTRREEEISEQSADDSAKTDAANAAAVQVPVSAVQAPAPAAAAQNCNDTQPQPQPQQVYSTYNNAVPGFRNQGRDAQRRRDVGRSRHRDRDSDYRMPWGGDLGGTGFSMPWGGDREGRGFRSPWDEDGFGFSGPWGNRDRGSRGRHSFW